MGKLGEVVLAGVVITLSGIVCACIAQGVSNINEEKRRGEAI